MHDIKMTTNEIIKIVMNDIITNNVDNNENNNENNVNIKLEKNYDKDINTDTDTDIDSDYLNDRKEAFDESMSQAYEDFLYHIEDIENFWENYENYYDTQNIVDGTDTNSNDIGYNDSICFNNYIGYNDNDDGTDGCGNYIGYDGTDVFDIGSNGTCDF